MSSIFGVGSGSATSLLQSFFKSADTDKSGSLDLSEFKAIRQNVPSNANISSEKMFAAVDANGDGAMTEDEVASFLKKYAPANGLLQLQESGTSSSLADKFKAADSDGDGKLNLDEFKAGFAAHSRRHHRTGSTSSSSSSDDKAKKRFDALDTNGDGQISADELAAGVAKNPNSSTGLFGLLLQATAAYSSSSTSTAAAALQTA